MIPQNTGNDSQHPTVRSAVAIGRIEMKGGIVVIDEYRLTIPRIMKEGVDADVPKHQSVHLLSPKSTLIHVSQNIKSAPTSKKDGGRKSITGATSANNLSGSSSISQGARWDEEEERKECMSDASSISFESWVKSEQPMPTGTISHAVENSTVSSTSRSSSLLLAWPYRCASSRGWDWAYLFSFLVWAVVRPLSHTMAILEPFIRLSLVSMALFALLASLLALQFRIRHPDVINNASREEKRFWGTFFLLIVRATAHKPSLCRKRKEEKVSAPPTPAGPLVRYYQKHHYEEDNKNGNKRKLTTISWHCRVCGTQNAAQPFRRLKKHSHAIRVVPFRNRARVVCHIQDRVDSNTCEKCMMSWDYRPRKSARHLFHPAQEGPPRKKARKLPRAQLRLCRQITNGFVRGFYALLTGQRHTASIEDMINKIQDDDQLYFLDYELRDLQKSYLMPGLERRQVRSVEDEEIECCERQPFHLPAVIKRVHANSTYDVMFASGEVAKNVFAINIRGRPLYRQYPWFQGMSCLILLSCFIFPAITYIPLPGHTLFPLMALVGCVVSTLALWVMYYHYRYIIKPLQPLQHRFNCVLARLWMFPFLLLWLSTACTFLKLTGFLPLLWTFVLIPSYAFSCALTFWLLVAKPVYGSMCAVLSIVLCAVEVCFGLWLDGFVDNDSNIPLVLFPFSPLYAFILLVFICLLALPFTWDGSLPRLNGGTKKEMERKDAVSTNPIKHIVVPIKEETNPPEQLVGPIKEVTNLPNTRNDMEGPGEERRPSQQQAEFMPPSTQSTKGPSSTSEVAAKVNGKAPGEEGKPQQAKTMPPMAQQSSEESLLPQFSQVEDTSLEKEGTAISPQRTIPAGQSLV